MAMTPEEKREFEELKALVQTLVRVENVPFIENINRRAVTGIRADGTLTVGSMTQTVNEAGAATYDVTIAPDVKLKILLPNGTAYYLPAFNS